MSDLGPHKADPTVVKEAWCVVFLCSASQPREALSWRRPVSPRCSEVSVFSPTASEEPSFLEEVSFLYGKGENVFLSVLISDQGDGGSGVAVQAGA